ncbi:hypothetical protein JOF53_003105 [Crossiella equi]|uniref:DUF3558 domain-containing protein n=1 Tax=Crossiella equi TaxID=130796 RepID=A0ABS5ACC3_9PSEU|nr:DUF3558 domain-containing protein [Crossiella equi]MBP2474233.1 hypothetical protein [Crossiella equi]
MSSVVRTTLVAGLALVTVAACSGGNGGGQQTATGSAAPSSTTATTNLAPTVDTPLALDSYASKPCELLKPAQLSAFGQFQPAKQLPESKLGPECGWNPPQARGVALVITVNTKSGGLEDNYRNKNTYPFFAPADKIAGYPAVNTNERDNIDSGDCYQYVGVSNTRTFRMSVYVQDERHPQYKTPCALASQVSAEVIKTLQGGG